MSVNYEVIEIKRDIELPGIGVISGSAKVSVPQVGFSTGEDGNETFDGLDLEELLNVIEVSPEKGGEAKTPAEIQTEREIGVVRHFNNGLKAALRSGAYASAGSLSAVDDSDEVKSLKKTLDSFVKNFGMSPQQAAAAVKNIPEIQTIITRLQESGILTAKTA